MYDILANNAQRLMRNYADKTGQDKKGRERGMLGNKNIKKGKE